RRRVLVIGGPCGALPVAGEPPLGGGGDALDGRAVLGDVGEVLHAVGDLAVLAALFDVLGAAGLGLVIVCLLGAAGQDHARGQGEQCGDLGDRGDFHGVDLFLE